jgi:hypothetical protein
MVVPQDVLHICSILPPRSDQLSTIIQATVLKAPSFLIPWPQVLFVGSGRPVPDHVQLRWLLGVRREKILAALEWLKLHNPEYKDVSVSADNAATYDDVGTDGIPRIPSPLFTDIHVSNDLKATAKDGSGYRERS